MSGNDVNGFPTRVKSLVGYALHLAQLGDLSEKAKPLKGLGAGVLEVIADHDGDTYRAVYTVRLASGVYVLHCFQKKGTHAIRTPRRDIALIKRRLAEATEHDKTVRR
jgi:phage-related protein